MSNRQPRILALALCVALAGIGGTASAQTVGYNIRTGDVWVDSRLGEINQYGRHHRDPFVREMTGHYGAPRSLVVELLDRRGWAPADVYFACAIARAAGLPCLDVVRQYDRNPGQGWGAVAKRMGIKPGSAEFHALKRGTAATYDRWGHPVSIDRNERVDWSRHGGGHDRGRGASHPAAGPGRSGPDSAGGPGKGNRGKGKGNGKGRGG